MEFQARQVLGGRVDPLTGHRMLYVACDQPGGAAPPAAPAEVAEVTWSTAGDLPRYLPEGISSCVQPYPDAALRA